jgi:alpha-galactosidase
MVNAAEATSYRAHPDWILRTPNRAPSVGRNQFVLDFSRDDVVDHIKGMRFRRFARRARFVRKMGYERY